MPTFSLSGRLLAWSLPLLSGMAAASADDGALKPANPATADFFESKVRPVLVANCLNCHGPEKQKSGLRVDSIAALTKGGTSGPAVVPGKPDESLLVAAIKRSGDIKMPPKDPLPPAVIADVERWVKSGAHWPESASSIDPRGEAWKRHWAFQRVGDPQPPTLKDPSRTQSPIDAFIVARLESAGLEPSQPASRTVLLRRASFDLIGLPPTPEESAAFEADPDPTPQAFAKVVDRLLASPHYGERWGRHWLDLARYSDTKGYVFLEDGEYPWAYTYRDYVIEALNRDLPYDQFIVEQIAADKLPPQNGKSALRALGFLTVGSRFMNNPDDIIDDRIDVVTRGLMGLTVACARCHDHKFDPIPTADYYSLRGIFASSTEPNLPPLFGDPPKTPEYLKYEAELHTREGRLDVFVKAKFDELIEDAMRRSGEYLVAAETAARRPDTQDFMLIADRMDLNPKMIRRWQSRLERARNGFDPVLTPLLRLANLPAAGFTDSARRELDKPGADAAQRVNPIIMRALLDSPIASFADAAARVGAVLYANELIGRERGARLALDARTETLGDPDRDQLRLVFHEPNGPLDVPYAPAGDLDLLPDRESQAELKKLKDAIDQWRVRGTGAPPRAMVLEDLPQPVEQRIYKRGNPGNQGDLVPRRFVACLSGKSRPDYSGSGRLELAKAIASAENPLTARALVNRVWMHHFGRPLVGTPGDFGMRSDPPSHPELLDRLAHDFIAGGWSLKTLHRTIMLSSTYQQASDDRAACLAADPEDSLYWRFDRRPLDFEGLRDAILAVSGRLDRTIGGPSMSSLSEAGSVRRTLYARVDRYRLEGLFRTFDFPSPDAASPKRDFTTTAPQSLFLLNNPWVIGMAEAALARPEIAAIKDRDAKVDALERLCFNRPATENERALARDFLGENEKAWPLLVQSLFMSNEFYFLD